MCGRAHKVRWYLIHRRRQNSFVRYILGHAKGRLKRLGRTQRLYAHDVAQDGEVCCPYFPSCTWRYIYTNWTQTFLNVCSCVLAKFLQIFKAAVLLTTKFIIFFPIFKLIVNHILNMILSWLLCINTYQMVIISPLISKVIRLLTDGLAVKNRHTKNPRDRESYDKSETAHEKLLLRRIHWCGDPRSVLFLGNLFLKCRWRMLKQVWIVTLLPRGK